MNKSELVAAIAGKAGVSKKDTEAILKAFIETVEETVKSGDKVQLIWFRTFEGKTRAARTGKNPRSGEQIKIAESKIPAFKVGAAFKDLLNK